MPPPHVPSRCRLHNARQLAPRAPWPCAGIDALLEVWITGVTTFTGEVGRPAHRKRLLLVSAMIGLISYCTMRRAPDCQIRDAQQHPDHDARQPER